MRSTLRLLTLAAVLGTLPAYAAPTYHVGTVQPPADGSPDAPFASLDDALAACSGGETIKLPAGDHEFRLDIVGNPPKPRFAKHVTIRPADGVPPRSVRIVNRVVIGQNGSQFFSPTEFNAGGYDANVAFVRLHLAAGITTYGARQVALVDCLVTVPGPWHGSAEAVNKVAIDLFGSDCSIDGCEVTDAGIGISVKGWRFTVRNSHIHDLTHDGLRLLNAKDCLVEGCSIHGLDDGVHDHEAKWSHHCDGIHVFMTNALPQARCERITIRGNRIYDVESQAFQANNHVGDQSIHNRDFTFEYNVFGPTGANSFNIADAVEGVTVQHNTWVRVARKYKSRFRELTLANANCRVDQKCGNVEIVNNVLAFPQFQITERPDWEVHHNLCADMPPAMPLGRFDILADPMFANPEAFDGVLLPDSPAIGAGTTGGDPYRRRPNIGAWQDPEPLPPPAPASPTVFRDDFADTDLRTADPWLNGPESIGLTWETEEGFWNLQRRNGVNELNPSTSPTLVCEIQADQTIVGPYTFSARVNRASATKGGEFLLFSAVDPENRYLLDTGLQGTARLYRVMDGERTLLAESPAASVAWEATVGVKVTPSDKGLRIEIARDGKPALDVTDDAPGAAERFGGPVRVGFRREPSEADRRCRYSAVRIEVPEGGE